MLIKTKETHQGKVDYLKDLLERDFPEDKKLLIERELKTIYSGVKGEETSAYYLEFDFKKSKNWALIHDLRIEHQGQVAQIDHLLIGRLLDFYVIESKNFAYGVSISDEGDFSYFHKNRPRAIASPIAQNERHIRLLEQVLMEKDLLPKRLGLVLKPTFHNIVLISPTSRLTKPKSGTFDCSMVMKSDRFIERMHEDFSDDSFSSMMNLTKVISQENLRLFAVKLAAMHQSVDIDYVAKFGLTQDEPAVEEPVAEYGETPVCPKCGKDMVRRTVKKGDNAGKAFYGCSAFPKCRATLALNDSTHESVQLEHDNADTDAQTPLCPKCESSMVRRISKKKENAKEFWGCSKFPKCRGVRSIDESV